MNWDRESWQSQVLFPFSRQERVLVIHSAIRFWHLNRPTRDPTEFTASYLEFGCHRGITLRIAWLYSRYLFNWNYVAFDSFQGLPPLDYDDEMPIWQEGSYKTTEGKFRRIMEEAEMPKDRLTIVPGFYEDSLTKDMQERLKEPKAAIVFIDCDLYKSTKSVLEFIPPLLQKGTILIFDDWNCYLGDPNKGERRAWREFREANPHLHFEDFVSTSVQKSFIYIGNEHPT